LEVVRPELDHQPVAVVGPDNHDPLSFLLTLQQVGDTTLDAKKSELPGVKLLNEPWEVIDRKRLAEELPKAELLGEPQDEAIFFRSLPTLGVKVAKIYRLARVPAEELENPDYPAYHLMLDVVLSNAAPEPKRLAYRLDGPTGLPLEGSWYANKVSQGSFFSSAGLRDVITQFQGGQLQQISPMQLAAPDFVTNWTETPLDYIAIDAQYFSAALIPQKRSPKDIWYSAVKPRRVGAIPDDKANYKLINISFELDGQAVELEPGGQLADRYQVFAGPKRPRLLAEYVAPGTNVSLGGLVYYGWFGVVARPMLVLLHGFYDVVGNYGLAIIMLTVLVRGCMFPLSRKQALATQKMQQLQPELKRLNEKFKSEPEKKTRATQELFRQHNYNPLGGCMLAFVQLPIFMGLYRSLMVDVELRQAPLFGEAIRWASNLAAPDMFWDWSKVVPDFVAHGTGFLGLGPYLNIFPLVTVGLFIWQQKMFMPPAADEQSAMQQKMMQYMTLFMGIMFFKVASGLCVYFIASSIWGIAERKLLPKTLTGGGDASSAATGIASSSPGGNGAPAGGKKRQRGRK
jgi:YidC/Oxa1 family membrane protein insertase